MLHFSKIYVINKIQMPNFKLMQPILLLILIIHEIWKRHCVQYPMGTELKLKKERKLKCLRFILIFPLYFDYFHSFGNGIKWKYQNCKMIIKMCLCVRVNVCLICRHCLIKFCQRRNLVSSILNYLLHSLFIQYMQYVLVCMQTNSMYMYMFS